MIISSIQKYLCLNIENYRITYTICKSPFKIHFKFYYNFNSIYANFYLKISISQYSIYDHSYSRLTDIPITISIVIPIKIYFYLSYNFNQYMLVTI